MHFKFGGDTLGGGVFTVHPVVCPVRSILTVQSLCVSVLAME
jgi:hypothetical protein